MKRTFVVESKVVIPGAVIALVLTMGAGWKLGQMVAQKPWVAEAAPKMETTKPAPLDASPSPTTPNAILDGIPDTGGEAATAKEVRRWREMVRRKENEPRYWVNLGDALMQRSRDLVDPHDYDWAKLCYEQALKKDAKFAPAITGLSWVTGALHQFDSSIAYAKEAIALNGSDPTPYGLLGDAQLEMGDYEGALDSYQKMLDLRPDMASYSRGAHLLYVVGDIQKALFLMRKAIRAGGPYGENSAWCKAQLAEMLWSTGSVLSAVSITEEGLKTAPKNYHLLTMRGRLYEAQKNPKAAIAAYQKAIAVSPQHHALVALGDLYLSLGQKDEAEKQFAEVETAHQHHQNHGNHDELYMARFWVDHDRNLDKAKAVVTKRLNEQGEPKGLADLENIAWIYYKLGNIPEAKRYIEKAMAKGTQDAFRLYHAGMIYAKAGDVFRGRKYLDRALMLNPNFHPLDSRMAVATLRELGSRPRQVSVK